MICRYIDIRNDDERLLGKPFHLNAARNRNAVFRVQLRMNSACLKRLVPKCGGNMTIEYLCCLKGDIPKEEKRYRPFQDSGKK